MPVQRHVVVVNKMGIHVRPATRIADVAGRSRASVHIIREGTVVDAKSPLDILTLAATEGTTLILQADGEGAEQVLEELARLFETRFGME